VKVAEVCWEHGKLEIKQEKTLKMLFIRKMLVEKSVEDGYSEGS
jgi:hypothetical protein